MTANQTYLAIDLGAESGRVMLGCLQDGRLEVTEAHRFPNTTLALADGLHWDVDNLWAEIKKGLGIASRLAGTCPAGIGLDTWGVDFGLLDDQDRLIAPPFLYRDSRTNGMVEAACRLVPRQEIYASTGIQFMQLNTLYQLFAMGGQADLARARALLFMPDLFNFWLTGVKGNEYTIASTSQCFNTTTGLWAVEMLEKLGIPTRIFGEIIPAGTRLGFLRPEISAETGCPVAPVVAVASHDTASAVAGVPAWTTDFIFLSSGTWSLMGMEIARPVVNPHSLACNVTNEGGVFGTTRLLKNIMGMWLLQECRRQWAEAGHKYSYDELTALAAQAPAFGSFIQPANELFLAPGGMVERIQQFCLSTGQRAPSTAGEITRCILESLALAYRRTAEQLENLTGKTARVLHIVGGGSRNALLNQFTADCTRKVVAAGPVEATAIGNILVQAVALGHIGSLKEGRQIVHNTFSPQVFTPRDSSAWDEAYARFKE
jgi:rhamnulokinase